MPFQRLNVFFAGVLLAAMLGGCATQAANNNASSSNKDPLEGLNRSIYKFNDTADKAVIKPIAGAYKAVVPSPLRTGVANFFSNLNQVPVLVNQLLQFKFLEAMDTAGRIAINTTVGIGGLFDVASMDKVPKHNEDLGQTLGYWGWENSTYLVIPFLGPSTVRDISGFAVDTMYFSPLTYVDDPRTRNQLRLLYYIDLRSQYLPGSDLLDEAALDPYTFMRDAYLQRRANLIHDTQNGPSKDEWGDDSGSKDSSSQADPVSPEQQNDPATASDQQVVSVEPVTEAVEPVTEERVVATAPD